MNQQLLNELIKVRQQALLAERWGHRIEPKIQPSWLTHIRNWLAQALAQAQSRPTLGQ